jgi:hypothetical protein
MGLAVVGAGLAHQESFFISSVNPMYGGVLMGTDHSSSKREQEEVASFRRWFFIYVFIQSACVFFGRSLWNDHDLDVLPQCVVAALPLTFWLYWGQRLRALRRTRPPQRSLELLYWGLLLSAAPLPIFLFYPEIVLFGVRLAGWVAWGWLSVWAMALMSMRVLLDGLVDWLLARDALAKDLSEGKAALPAGRVVGSERPLGVWRKVQVALCGLGTMVILGVKVMIDGHLTVLPSHVNTAEVPLIVGSALCLLIGGGLIACQLKWAKRPQSGVLFSPWLTLLDVLTPRLLVMVLGAFGFIMPIGFGMPDNGNGWQLGLLVASILYGVVIILHVPAHLLLKDLAQWRASWDADNAAELTALSRKEGVTLWTRGQGLLAMTGLVDHAYIPHLRAMNERVPCLYTGDLAFDARFDVLQVTGFGLGALGADVRAEMLALHNLQLSVDDVEVSCQVLFPWRVGVAAHMLARLARAWLPPQGPAWETFVAARQSKGAVNRSTLGMEWRLLSGALRDPIQTARCVCAQALVDAWLREGTLWVRLREQVAEDIPSLALLRVIISTLDQRDSDASRHVLAALAVDAPWPTQGEAFAQALWVSALDHLDDADARAALSSPLGRLLMMPALFAVRVAARAVEVAADADGWLIEALGEAQYPEHQAVLCQALGHHRHRPEPVSAARCGARSIFGCDDPRRRPRRRRRHRASQRRRRGRARYHRSL